MTTVTAALLLFYTLSSNAQSPAILKMQVEEEVSAFFTKDRGIFERVADSGKQYRFFFQIDVRRADNKSFFVTSISASDTIAYQLYPAYHSLKNLRWDLYMHRRGKASFVIPVVLEVISSKGETYQFERSEQLKSFSTLFNDDENIDDYIYFRPVVFLISKEVFD